MCTLKMKDNKDCTRKVEECTGWLYHKEVVHGIGWSPFRCCYCDKPVAQINKIKPHETVCSSSETKKSEKLIDCEYCTKSFCQHQYYLSHVSTVHVTAARVPKTCHHCNTCGQDYANPSSLHSHKCHLQGQKRWRKPKSAST